MEFVFMSAIVGLVCGMVAIAIAEGKGHPKSANGKWFATGFFLGPIGVVIALLSSKQTAGFVEQGKMKVCPFCKESILAEAIVCKHCQSKLD